MRKNPAAEPRQSNWFDAGSRWRCGPSILFDPNRHGAKFGV